MTCPNDYAHNIEALIHDGWTPAAPRPDCSGTATARLERVDRLNLVSGERVIACKPGADPLHGNDCYVIDPEHLWRLGWLLDGPEALTGEPRLGGIGQVCREDHALTGHVVHPLATQGLLVLSAYAVGGRFRVIRAAHYESAVRNVLTEMALHHPPTMCTIHVPLGYALATLDPEVELWRRAGQ